MITSLPSNLSSIPDLFSPQLALKNELVINIAISSSEASASNTPVSVFAIKQF